MAIICLIAYLDGGLTSPATLMLFLTLVFAALSYPLGSMIVVVVASVTGVAVLGLVGGATDKRSSPIPPTSGCSSSAWRSPACCACGSRA